MGEMHPDLRQLLEDGSGGMRRRELLRRAGLLGLSTSAVGAVLSQAACGDDVRKQANAGDLESEVNVYASANEWEHAVEPFMEQTGVKVNLTFVSDPTATAQAIRQSPGNWDVVSFDSTGAGFLEIALGNVVPLDVQRLSNWKSQPQRFRADAQHEGKVYGVPFYWGGTILGWNTDAIETELDSWSTLWDPKYEGKVSVLDSPSELFGMVSLALGQKRLNDTSAANLQRTKEKLLELIPNVKTFWSTGTDIEQFMSGGEVELAHIWDGTIRGLAKNGESVKSTFPREGVRYWMEVAALVKDAPHPNAAYAWINFVTSPKIGAEMSEKFLYAPTNSRSYDLLSPETKDIILADQTDEILSTFVAGKDKRLTADQIDMLAEWLAGIHAEAGT